MENFKEKFDSFLKGCQTIVDEYMKKNYPNLSTFVLVAETGRRYIRVMRTKGDTNESCWAFVDQTNGNVLKPATYKAPAKHARGNIFDDKNGLGSIGPYGPAYLR